MTWYASRFLFELNCFTMLQSSSIIDLKSVQTISITNCLSMDITQMGYLFHSIHSNIMKLKRDQNSIARILTGTRRSKHITPVLARIHLIKLAERI